MENSGLNVIYLPVGMLGTHMWRFDFSTMMGESVLTYDLGLNIRFEVFIKDNKVMYSRADKKDDPVEIDHDKFMKAYATFLMERDLLS